MLVQLSTYNQGLHFRSTRQYRSVSVQNRMEPSLLEQAEVGSKHSCARRSGRRTCSWTRLLLLSPPPPPSSSTFASQWKLPQNCRTTCSSSSFCSSSSSPLPSPSFFRSARFRHLLCTWHGPVRIGNFSRFGTVLQTLHTTSRDPMARFLMI